MDAMRALLLTPAIHKKFESANGEAAIASLKVLLNLHHDPHPWNDLWRAIAAEHLFRDAWWDDRNLLPLLDRVELPVYLGCDWQNATTTAKTVALICGPRLSSPAPGG